jgi:hypothetical protein
MRRIILASFFSLMATVSSGSKASAGWFICKDGYSGLLHAPIPRQAIDPQLFVKRGNI